MCSRNVASGAERPLLRFGGRRCVGGWCKRVWRGTVKLQCSASGLGVRCGLSSLQRAICVNVLSLGTMRDGREDNGQGARQRWNWSAVDGSAGSSATPASPRSYLHCTHVGCPARTPSDPLPWSLNARVVPDQIRSRLATKTHACPFPVRLIKGCCALCPHGTIVSSSENASPNCSDMCSLQMPLPAPKAPRRFARLARLTRLPLLVHNAFLLELAVILRLPCTS